MVSMEGNQARRKRRKFTAEFKERAVNLVLKQGMSVADVARDLDVVASGLHQWVRQAKIDQGKGPPGALTTEEKLELAQLRKENRILREERDILKKAAAFFAKENR
jgi:transposase